MADAAQALALGCPDLTGAQSSAVEFRAQDACIVAGPGSGKTTVLVERYRRLVEERGFDPRQILAITFTEKAAANMKARLASLFAQNAVLRRDLESAWVSTIHGFCARLLRENAIAAAIDPRFTVLDAREAEELQFDCLNRAFDELTEARRPEALALIEALNTPYIIPDLRTAYDAMRCAGKTVEDVRSMPSPSRGLEASAAAKQLHEIVTAWPALLTATQSAERDMLLEWAARLVQDACLPEDERFAAVCGLKINLNRVPRDHSAALRAFREETLPLVRSAEIDRRFGRFREIVFDALARFDLLYKERKAALGALDFTDLEKRAIDLLRGDREVRERIRREFRQVMLDEFQDINRQQWDLISLVRGDDVFFAVGDVNQSIYGFRHACPEILDDYRSGIETAGKHSAALFDNFRSRPEVLQFAEAILSEAEGIQERELAAGKPRFLKSEPSIEILRIEDADKEAAVAREARWIRHRILALRGSLALPDSSREGSRKADFGDFAVLCRNGDSMRPILEEFDFAGIPYICGRRQSFLLSREGRDITALLRTIANPRDSIALATVLRSALAGVSDEGLLRLRLLAGVGGTLTGGLNIAAHDVARLAEFSALDAAEIERFAANLKEWRAEQPVLPLDVLIVRALKDCAFEWIPGSSTGANVESFLDLARRRGARPLSDFLREIESLENAITTESDLSDADKGNRVQVMTAHAAKGLEFPITIIAAIDKRPRSDSATVTFTPDAGLGMKWKDPLAGEGLEDSWQARNKKLIAEREARESNRLLYVAMTRAEEHLILSYSRAKDRRSDWASRIDKFFQFDGRSPGETWIEERSAIGRPSFQVSITYTCADPPETSRSFAGGEAPDEVLVIEPLSGHDHHDSVVNVTALALFANCPRKYYLERYIGWDAAAGKLTQEDKLPAQPHAPAAELGSMVHEILAGKTGSYPAEAHKLAAAFTDSELGKKAATARRIAREWDFITEINDSLVRGTVDLWFEDDCGIQIVDYKTDDVSASDAPARATEYAPQLALYALALARACGKRPAKAWLHFLRPNLLIEVPIDDVALRSAEDLIGRLRDAQNMLRFELHEGEHCRSCAFYAKLCPAGGPR